MGEAENINNYYILNEKCLNQFNNIEIDDLKTEIIKYENLIQTYLLKTSETKPNFEIPLKEVLDNIYNSQKFLRNNKLVDFKDIKEFFLNSYFSVEQILYSNYYTLYPNSFSNKFNYLFSSYTDEKVTIKTPEWLNDKNPTTEAFFSKNELDKIFKDFNSYKIFLELKKLLCTDDLQTEYAFIYRKMFDEKLINFSISESYFRYKFLEKQYIKELNNFFGKDVEGNYKSLQKLKGIRIAAKRHREIIYSLVWDKYRPKGF